VNGACAVTTRLGGANVAKIVQPRELVCIAALSDPDSHHHYDC
jgi:hypothetical protein